VLAIIVVEGSLIFVLAQRASTDKSSGVTSNDKPQLVVQSGHSNWVYSAQFSADGRFVLTGSADKTACLWDAAMGLEVKRFVGHSGGINSVAISKDGRWVITGSDDKTARLWDIATGQEIRRFPTHEYSVHSVAISPDGRFVLTGSGNNVVQSMGDDISNRRLPGNTAHDCLILLRGRRCADSMEIILMSTESRLLQMVASFSPVAQAV
jgi:WD40 repeat protein